MPGERESFCRWVGRSCCCLAALFFSALSVQAAYVSEIDLGGPAGQGIELSQVKPASDYTMLFINASPTSTFLFGMVMDVLHLPAGTGRAGVAMVTDSAWPSAPSLTTPRSSLALESGDATLPLFDHLLLVVMEGRSDVNRFMNPLSDAAANTAYDETAVTDWLVLSKGDQSASYESKSDLDDINAELGIDLLARLVETDAGRVIARSNEPGQDIDMDTFYSGDPDPTSRQFGIGNEWVYTYTPGMNNLPLAAHLPEPNTLAIFVLSLGLVARRSRRGSGMQAA